MKKSTLIGLAFTSLFAVTLATQTVEAAPTAAKNATFKLEPTKEPGGGISIVEAPAINFKSTVISSAAVATDTDAEAPKFVFEDASGTGQGWDVKAKIGEFVGTKGEGAAKNKLYGAKVTFPAALTSAKNLSIAGQDANAPTLVANTELTATDKKLFDAAANKGVGKWEVTLGGANKIKLTAPAGNLADTYTAVITYTIAATPTPTPPGE